MSTFFERYERYRTAFEHELEAFCEKMDYTPRVLTESMRYSLRAGGKRVRPVLFFAALDCLGVDFHRETALALALECVHTYSLIHDDLPAMDNDDFRRGRPSNHKMFGEANAILAGDGLLSLAFELALNASTDDAHRRAAGVLAEAAGPSGMIAGQSADLLYENTEATDAELQFVHCHKTGKLIAAPLRMAAAIAGREEEALRAYGENLGVLFQLTDDILDEKGSSEQMGKTLGKDKKEGKLTCVRLYGLEKSEELADAYTSLCRENLQNTSCDVSFLLDFTEMVRSRQN